MANIIHWLLPKEEKFFEMLAEQSENAVEAAKELKLFVSEYEKLSRSERKSKLHAIEILERKGDEILHKIIEKLDKTYMSPIDKEDINKIAMLLHDLTDLTSHAALRLVILSIERINDNITKLVSIVESSVVEINKSVFDLKKPKDMKEHYSKIHSLRNEAKEAYHEALSELFHFYKNSVDIIKYKDIYELLESAARTCESATRIIQSVVAKHS